MSAPRHPAWVNEPDVSRLPHGLPQLATLAFVGGALTGVVGAAFRWVLIEADQLRLSVVDWAQQFSTAGLLFPVLIAAIAVGLARYITRLVPEASGSGIQRVEASMRGEVPLAKGRILPAKFIGGALALGAGLGLGREGPTVQMGASIGSKLGKVFKQKRGSEELEAGLAGAGLAVAFNAPLGGAIFVFEELSRAFRLRLVVATLVGAGTAVTVSRQMLGNEPEFIINNIPNVDLLQLATYVVLGLVIGLMSGFYNRSVVFFLDFMEKIKRLPPEAKAAIVGGLVGGVGFYFPALVGGGENIAQTMMTDTPLPWAILGIIVFRWFLGTISYSLGTPGGLFSPLLAMGAATGALGATVANALIPTLDLHVASFAFVGMSAFFAGVVRAPFTGVIIVAEMANSSTLLMPSLLAAAGAVIAATLIRSEPIYDTLRPRSIGWTAAGALPGPPTASPPDESREGHNHQTDQGPDHSRDQPTDEHPPAAPPSSGPFPSKRPEPPT
jgi:CIC family chloride channel protein